MPPSSLWTPLPIRHFLYLGITSPNSQPHLTHYFKNISKEPSSWGWEDQKPSSGVVYKLKRPCKQMSPWHLSWLRPDNTVTQHLFRCASCSRGIQVTAKWGINSSFMKASLTKHFFRWETELLKIQQLVFQKQYGQGSHLALSCLLHRYHTPCHLLWFHLRTHCPEAPLILSST